MCTRKKQDAHLKAWAFVYFVHGYFSTSDADIQNVHADFFVPVTKKRMKDYYIIKKEFQHDELNEMLISLMYEGWQLCIVNEIQVSYQVVFKKRL